MAVTRISKFYSLLQLRGGITRSLCPLHRAESTKAASNTKDEIAQLVHLYDKMLESEDYFGVRDLVTVEDLFKARVHLGHKQGLRNDFMRPYIYGNRHGVDIIDLDQTLPHLHLALNVVAHMTYRDGISLFFCRSARHSLLIEKTAQECKEFAHCRNWEGGLFTNSVVQYKSVTRLPDTCIFLNTQNALLGVHEALVEATKVQLLSVGVVDTNCDPRLVSYPIPGNDDTPSAMKLYCKLFKTVILRAKEQRKKDGLDTKPPLDNDTQSQEIKM